MKPNREKLAGEAKAANVAEVVAMATGVEAGVASAQGVDRAEVDVHTKEAFTKLNGILTRAKTRVQKPLQNLDSGFRRNPEMQIMTMHGVLSPSDQILL